MTKSLSPANCFPEGDHRVTFPRRQRQWAESTLARRPATTNEDQLH